MTSLISRSLLCALPLSFSLGASDVVPSVPLVPSRAPSPPQAPSTNQTTMPLLSLTQTRSTPYFDTNPREMFSQRLSERMVDPFTPTALSSITDSARAYHNFAQDAGEKIMLGASRRVVQDLAVGRLLPAFTWGTGKLSSWIDGLAYGSVHGPQGRDQRPLTSMYYSSNDLLFAPEQEHPLAFSYSIDPLRTDPLDDKLGGTLMWRRGSRIFRAETSAREARLTFDAHDSRGLVRLGSYASYEKSMNSSAYVSFIPRSVYIPSLTIGVTLRGSTSLSLSLVRSF